VRELAESLPGGHLVSITLQDHGLRPSLVPPGKSDRYVAGDEFFHARLPQKLRRHVVAQVWA